MDKNRGDAPESTAARLCTETCRLGDAVVHAGAPSRVSACQVRTFTLSNVAVM